MDECKFGNDFIQQLNKKFYGQYITKYIISGGNGQNSLGDSSLEWGGNNGNKR